MVVLLTEGASLTARETLTVLGDTGRRADVMLTRPLGIARFSRTTRHCIRAPAPSRDPFGYLSLLAQLLADGSYEAVLATHEQGWLIAAGRTCF